MLSDAAWMTLFPHLAERKSDRTDYFVQGISECFYCFDAFGNLKPFLDKHGFICVPQQSWMAYADDNPKSAEQLLLDGMLLLPNFHNLDDKEIRRHNVTFFGKALYKNPKQDEKPEKRVLLKILARKAGK